MQFLVDYVLSHVGIIIFIATSRLPVGRFYFIIFQDISCIIQMYIVIYNLLGTKKMPTSPYFEHKVFIYVDNRKDIQQL